MLLRIRIGADVFEHNDNFGFLRRREISLLAERLVTSEDHCNISLTNSPF